MRSGAGASEKWAGAARRDARRSATGRWRPGLYRARDRLLKARERLPGRERRRLPSFTALAAGIRLWHGELLAYFDEPMTLGNAEGIVNKHTRRMGMSELRGLFSDDLPARDDLMALPALR